MNNVQVFFVPGRQGIIDYAVEHNGNLVGECGGKTRAQLEVEYPGVTVGDYETVQAAQQEALKTAPVVISYARFIEMRDVLPPEDWRSAAGSESFKLCERQSGNITLIFARIGKVYYEFLDDARLTHAAIVEKIESASRKARVPATV